ncbi:hypothetical protein [Actinomyces respiraculi]|uniref:hypothetical protein n=1 Tax=Actinomyces respiraculi TaxID=2744574 RepID=UPI00141EB2F7|nr:hypothetical protein [Actinomyces respiraculi]
MAFKGIVLSIGELVEQAQAEPSSQGPTKPDDHRLLHTAAGEAADGAMLLRRGASLTDVWRFGIIQALDDYASTVQRGGIRLGARFFDDEPAPTGAIEVDAAFAALAEHLAERDGWEAPTWAGQPWRVTTGWYPDVIAWERDEARRTSPPAFRQRGIYITPRALERA